MSSSICQVCIYWAVFFCPLCTDAVSGRQACKPQKAGHILYTVFTGCCKHNYIIQKKSHFPRLKQTLNQELLVPAQKQNAATCKKCVRNGFVYNLFFNTSQSRNKKTSKNLPIFIVQYIQIRGLFFNALTRATKRMFCSRAPYLVRRYAFPSPIRRNNHESVAIIPAHRIFEYSGDPDHRLGSIGCALKISSERTDLRSGSSGVARSTRSRNSSRHRLFSYIYAAAARPT